MVEKLKVVSQGQGRDLVLIHGWAMHSGIWGGVVDALATGFRVHLVDLPGHGFNRDVPLSRQLDELAGQILSEVPPAAWLGWSLGGLVALAAAGALPQKVEKLLLVGATPSFSRQENWEWGLGASARQAFSEGLEQDFEATVSQFSLQTFGAVHLQESLRRLGEPPVTDHLPSLETLHDGLHLLYHNNLLPVLHDITMPTLFLGGSRDRTILPESFGQAASLMPNAEVNIIRGAGHAPFISHEEKFLEIVNGFLAEGQVT